MYYKKPFLLLVAFLISVMPIAPALVQAESAPSINNTNTVIEQQPTTPQENKSLDWTILPPSQQGDFFYSEEPKTKEAPPAQEVAPKPVEKIVGTPIAMPEIEEEPPGLDEILPSQSLENREAGVSKDQSNLFDIAPTGAFVLSYPIEIPKGRNNLQPQIKLTYNNQDNNKQNFFGIGWSLNIPYIERLNKTGINYLYSTSTTNYFNSSLSGELIQNELTENNIYIPIIETGDYYKYEFATSTSIWTATDKQGTIYTFGDTASSRQDNPDDSTKIYKWMLSEIRDSNDNYISYIYYKDEGQIYPSTINYTGYDETDGIFEVNFLRETRYDNLKSFLPGFEVTNNNFINEIKIEINDGWVKKYEINYTTSTFSNLSLLDKITESGRDSQGNTITLDPDEFTYNFIEENWTQEVASTTPWELPVNIVHTTTNGDMGVRLTDVNGDGLTDIIKSTTGSEGNKKVYLNTSDGWEEATSTSWIVPVSFVEADFPHEDLAVRLADVNGDGLVDILQAGTAANYDAVYLNNGDGWTQATSTSWDIPVAFLDTSGSHTDTGARLADVNGDGLADIIQSMTGGYNYDNVYINNGNGWNARELDWDIPVSIVDSLGKDQAVRLADVNGDGLVDILQAGTAANYDAVYFSNGHGWTQATSTSWDVPVAFLDTSGDHSDTGARLADVNSDGLADIIQAGSIYNYDNTFINNGNGWNVDDDSWDIPIAFVDTSGDHSDTGARLADFNGDGLVDIVQSGSTYNYNNAHDKNGINNFLSTIDYNTGGKIAIKYKPSSQIKEDNDDLSNPNLPYILQTVEEIQINDGLATSTTINYHFKGGENYYTGPYDKKFAGFSQVEKTIGNQKTITYLHQGNDTNSSQGEYQDNFAKIGKPYRVEVYDNITTSSPVLLKQDLYKWDSYVLATTTMATSTFVYKIRDTSSIFNNSGSHKDTTTEYTYSTSTGNLLTEENKGEVTANIQTGSYTDVSGDSKKTTYEYASNEDKHILSAVKTKTIEDPGTAQDLPQDYYYDDLGHGSIDKYNLTKEDLPDQTIDYEYTYNDYGLVKLRIDPYDNITTTTYDNYNLYVATTTNPLNQSTFTQYNLANGQVATTTDPNGLKVVNKYDVLGRLIEVKTTNPASVSEFIIRQLITYEDDDFPRYRETKDYFTTSNYYTSREYYDGLGRVIQGKTQTTSSIVWITDDTDYDEHGNVERQSLPYLTSSINYSSPDLEQPAKEYTHDVLDRILTETTPVGTTTNTYDRWTTTITDANSKDKDLTSDAYNRLIEVKEYNDGDTYTTSYEYNYLDKLTKITDEQSNLRNFTYDDLGRLTSQEEMHKATSTTYGTWSYQYDANSNITQKTDPKNQVMNYTYDVLNRKLTEDYTGATSTEATFVYDLAPYGIGKLASSTTSMINTVYEYDIFGRTTKETKTYPVIGRSYVTKYTYDLQNNPLKIIYPDRFYARYTYNSVGQTNQVFIKNSDQAEQEIISNITYTPLGQMDDIIYANGTIINNTHDPDQLYRLTEKTTATSTTPFQNITYTYDAVGNITKITDTTSNQLAKTSNFVYDDLYRLATSTIVDDFNHSTTTYTFTYDPIGNITNKSDVGNYFYNNSNPYQANSVNGRSYVYDNNGNLISGVQKTMTYDFNDRMSSITKGATTTLYYYDTGMDRVAKVDQATHDYKLYPSKYMEDSRNNSKKKYVFLGNMRLATIDQTTTSTPLIYLNFEDHLNSSAVTTDNNGNITNFNDYLPYGGDRINIQLGSFDPNYKFTDQELDGESDLYYYGARYYEQDIGRFIQSDPLSLYLYSPQKVEQNTQRKLEDILSNPQYLNYYAYAMNNPIAYVDPDGNISFRPLFNSTYNAFSNYGGLIKDSFNAYRANANYRAIEKTRQYYNEYNNLSGQDKQSYLNSSREGYAQIQRSMEVSENAVLGMVGGGYTSKYGNAIAQKMVSIESKFLREGIKATEHTIHRTATRASRGVTVDKVIDTVKTGKKYYDTLYKNYSYFKDGIRVAEDLVGNLRTVVTQNNINLERFIEIIK